MKTKKEVWKPIPKYEGRYEVSDHGNVRGLPRARIKLNPASKVVGPMMYRGGIKRQTSDRDGYKSVLLYGDEASRKNCRVHRLVLETFIGDCPVGFVACHNDGNEDNNCLENLRWDTQKNNLGDRRKHGTEQIGERAVNVKLKEADIKQIRSRLAAGEEYASIARDFGVTKENIGCIKRGETWSHV